MALKERKDKLDRVAEWEQSGLSQKAYCKAHGIAYSQFKNWRTRQLQQSSKLQKVQLTGYQDDLKEIRLQLPSQAVLWLPQQGLKDVLQQLGLL